MKYYGMYRALVITNKDPEMFGRVKLYVPDIMPEIDPIDGSIWALPANNPIGGRNESFSEEVNFAGTCYIPPKGSWIWCFMEGGNPNKPFYFGSLDLKNTKVLPENQVGSDYQKKWTIFKSHEGRCIVISDDEDDCRVEITGKKRKLDVPPTGNVASVYQIDENQTTILLDEREDREQLLIRTHKGDFIDINITDQTLRASFKGGITIASEGNVYLKGKKINIKSDMDCNIQAGKEVNIKGMMNTNIEASITLNLKGNNTQLGSGGVLSIKAGGTVAIDGSMTMIQQGLAQKANGAGLADSENPTGERNKPLI